MKAQKIRLSWMILFVIMALVVAGCAAPAAPAAAPAASSSEAAAPAEAAPAAPAALTRDNTLIFAADMTDLISLDPAVAYEFGGIEVVGNVYETLVSFDPGQPGLKPLLAESWDIADSGDMWTVTFKLNPAATFASGNPVTAEDVVFSWSRAIEINKSPAFLFIEVAQITPDSMSAVDAQTFQVNLPKTVSPSVFLSVITFSIADVLEKAMVEANAGDDMGSAWLNDNSAGSGPYVLADYKRSAQVTLDANPNYWGTAPIMQRVILQNMPDMSNLLAAIETGDADIVQDLSPEAAASLEGNPNVNLVKADSNYLIYVGMNSTKAPLDNPDVREAIRYAINYDDLITLLKGSGRLVQEIIPTAFLGYTGVNPFTQDIAKAKELLAGAGVAEGTELSFLVSDGTAAGGMEWAVIAALIQSNLAEVGLKVNIQQMTQAQLLDIYRAQGGELTLMNWGPDYQDPDGNATPFANWDAHSLAWRNDWNDATAIQLSKDGAIATDEAQRVEIYRQLVEYVQHNGPYVMLYQPTRTYGLGPSVTGFISDPADTPGVTLSTIAK